MKKEEKSNMQKVTEAKMEFEYKLNQLEQMNPENVNFIDNIDEAISYYKKYKDLFIQYEWNPMVKKHKRNRLLVQFTSIIASFGLSFGLIGIIAIILNISSPTMITYLVGIISTLAFACPISYLANKALLPLVDYAYNEMKNLVALNFNYQYNRFEKVLAKKQQKVKDIIDVNHKVIKEEEETNDLAKKFPYLYEEETIFTLRNSQDMGYSKTKKF